MESSTQVHPEIIVTTHMNADLDGFSAMLAATYLYPAAVPVLPDTAEPAVRRVLSHPFFQTRLFYTWRDVDIDRLHTVIVVDAGAPERIGPVYDRLRERVIHWIVYDTHPVEHLPDHVEVHTELCGATTTILVRCIAERGLTVSSLEATLMALGIFEDTGFFTFMGTCAEDLEAAAFLLRQGADVRMIRDWLQIHLDEVQTQCLEEIRANLEVLPVAGANVYFAGLRRERFVPDLSLVVHRLMDEMPVEVLFVALETPRHVYVIGRSRSQRVDVGAILAEWGGGGHAYAGSTSIRGQTINEIKERLIRTLEQRVPQEPRAGDIMVQPVKTIEVTTSVAEASDWMNLLRVNALPVREGDRIVGIVDRQVIDQARAMGLAARSVHEIMAAAPPIVSSQATLDEVAEVMLQHRVRLVLVTDAPSQIVGVITRMELLRARYDWMQLSAVRLARPSSRRLNYWRRIERLCPPAWVRYLVEIGDLAERHGWRAYLVGGVVRDIVMDRTPQDIDIVVEGVGIELARAWAARYGARVHAYEQFGTAVVVLPDGQRIDFATARTETYAYPGAPPRVEVGTMLRQDLYRRDFTINAMALALHPSDRGALVDPFGGLRDVHEGLIRVLHSLSFFEDPARLLRALRFTARYNFRLSPETERLFLKARDAGVLARLPGSRQGLELRYLFSERAMLEVFRLMTEYDLWRALHPRWNWRTSDLDQVRQAVEVFDWWRITTGGETSDAWMFWALVAMQRLPGDVRMEQVDHFQWPTEMRTLLESVSQRLRPFLNWFRRHPNVTPGETAYRWRDWSVWLVLFLMVIADPPLRETVRRFLSEWQHMRPYLTGRDLQAVGLPPGPVYRRILDDLWMAQVNGEVRSMEEARRWLTERLAR